jgi:hypothetical protein
MLTGPIGEELEENVLHIPIVAYIYIYIYIYTLLPPDDGQLASLKHVEV